MPAVVVGWLPLDVDVGRLTVAPDVVVGLVLVDVGLVAGLVVGLFVGRPVLIVPPPIVPPPLAGSCWANTLPAPMNNRVVNTVRETRGRRRRVDMSCSPAAKSCEVIGYDCLLLLERLRTATLAYCCEAL